MVTEPPGLDPILVAAWEAQSGRVAAWLNDGAAAGLAVAGATRALDAALRTAEVLASAPRAARGARAQPLTATLALAARAAPAGGASGPGVAADRDLPPADPAVPETAAALRDRFARSVGALRARLAGLAGDPLLAAPTGAVRASDLLRLTVLGLVRVGVLHSGGPAPDRQAVRVSCRMLTQVLAERYPGRSVEVRVPPYAAVQLGGVDGSGPTHTRGTPPNVVECSPEVFLAVALGGCTWSAALAAGQMRCSGVRADLGAYLPLLP